MLYKSNSRRSAAAILLVIMFLSADVLVTQMAVDLSILEEDNVNQTRTSSVTSRSQVYISSLDVNYNYALDSNLLIGENSTDEARGLMNFPNAINPSDTIQAATLSLFCVNNASPMSEINAYVSSLESPWNATESTWVNSNATLFWQQQGAEAIGSDRSDWETPASESQVASSGVYNFSFNVTKLVQQDAVSNSSSFDFLLSALGGMLQCAKPSNQTTSYHPVLFIESEQISPGNGGNVTQDFAVDGLPLMSSDVLLRAETIPTLSYTNLTGENVEFQLSLGADFRNTSDLGWVYSTISDPFIVGANSGNYTIPAIDELSEGTIVYYRIRALDSTGMIGEWTNGNFLLPYLDVVDNRDGTATISISGDDLFPGGMKIIEDSELNSSNSAAALGTNHYVSVESTLSTESVVKYRINSHLIGLNSTSSILSADLELTRTSLSASPSKLSLHQNDVLDWVEDEVRWREISSNMDWPNGPIGEGGASNSILMSDQVSSNFLFSVEDSIQSNLDNGIQEGLEMSLISRIGNEAYSSSSNYANFGSSDNPTPALQPKLNLTYLLGQSNSISSPELLSPVDG
ncbi:MAG: hypothetical protein P8Q94_01475, partial [Candidatus Poseidoniaceae archaeon]|nr:hypothetical protein [Candidatus Poseidoniaceae archaeon]